MECPECALEAEAAASSSSAAGRAGRPLRINDEAVDLSGRVANGYVRIERQWHGGDRVQLDLVMPVERVYVHPAVRADAGCVALQRGPLLYCLEQADNAVELHRIALPRDAALEARFEPNVLDGITTITGTAQVAAPGPDDSALYRSQPPPLRTFPITAVPYYAWDNRAPGQMRVWIHELVL